MSQYYLCTSIEDIQILNNTYQRCASYELVDFYYISFYSGNIDLAYDYLSSYLAMFILLFGVIFTIKIVGKFLYR